MIKFDVKVDGDITKCLLTFVGGIFLFFMGFDVGLDMGLKCSSGGATC